MIIKKTPEDFVVTEIPKRKPSKKGKWKWFQLKKRSLTTPIAISKIAGAKHVNPQRIKYAGLKDKYAVTSQVISIYDVDEEGVELDECSINFIGCDESPVSLGDLSGNSFDIKVYDADKRFDEIFDRLDCFVNYFDEQRFSKNNVNIGKAIIVKDMETIKEHFSDFGAMSKDPNIRLYIHAFQSMIWNSCVCEMVSDQPHIPFDTSFGRLIFPKEPICDESYVELVGFASKQKIVIDMLARHGLTLRDLIIRHLPQLSPEGHKRNIYCRVRNKSRKENVYSFELGAGSYATMFMKYVWVLSKHLKTDGL